MAARIRTTRSKAASSKSDNPKDGIAKAASSVATGSKRKREDDVDAVSTQWRKSDKQPGFQVLLPSPPARKKPRLPWYALDPADQERFGKENPPVDSSSDESDEAAGAGSTGDGSEESSSEGESEDDSKGDSKDGSDEDSEEDSEEDSKDGSEEDSDKGYDRKGKGSDTGASNPRGSTVPDSDIDDKEGDHDVSVFYLYLHSC